MKRGRLIAVGFALLSPVFLFADEDKSKKLSTLLKELPPYQIELPNSEPLQPKTPLMEKALKTYAALPFDVGERIRYLITYLGVRGGTAELNVRTPVKWKDGWAHRITGEAINAEWTNWFIVLRDGIEALIDSGETMSPLRFYMNQNEGNYHQTRLIRFDLPNKKIFQRTKRKDKQEVFEEFPFEHEAKDAVGALYYFRKELAAGRFKDKVEFDVFTNQKTWTAKGELIKRETVKVEGIKYDADVFELRTMLGAHLQQKGKFRMWITHDDRRLPVLIEADVKFGVVKLALVQWDPGFPDVSKKQYPAIRAEGQ